MRAFADTFFKYFAFRKDDPNYDWRNLNFDKDVHKMDEVREMLDAVDPDLSAFRARGGKIIHYHGWADTGPPASFSVKYYDEVLAAMGAKKTLSFYRLFMVPGMFHCNGGFGPDVFDPMTSLIEWVERGTPPDQMTGLQVQDGAIKRSLPLCPYPQIAKYNGAGDVNKADSFVCRLP
jgi:feruloyl esterase